MAVDTWICPGCGSELRVGVSGCPKCSRPKWWKRSPKKKPKPVRKSWEQDPDGDGLDLPDEEFDYDEFVAREFGKMPHRKVPIKWYWWVTAVVILAGMILMVF